MKVFTSKAFITKLKWMVNELPNVYHSENGTWCTLHNGKWWMDCVVSIKGLLWGFKGDTTKSRGGATYLANGVADFQANDGVLYCDNVSKDFNNLVPGEYLCMRGTKYSHAGVYLGNNQVFECTTGFGANKCIISTIDKYGNRYYNGAKSVAKWTYHGKLQYIDYSDQSTPSGNEKVRKLQQVLNQQYGSGLVEDGIFGNLTANACSKNYLYKGKKASIHIKWLQNRLVELGYSVGRYGIDGSFGNDTLNAVKQFQRDRGLVVDGYVGKDTHRKLVE